MVILHLHNSLSYRRRARVGRFCGCLLVLVFVTNDCRAAVSNQESVNALTEQASVLRLEWREESLRSAIQKYREGQLRSAATGNYEWAAQMAKNAGDVYFLLGEYRNALEQYQEARSLWQHARNKPAEMQALSLTGYVQVYLGQSKKALEVALTALTYYQHHRRAQDREALRLEAEAENCAGEANASLGRLHGAIEHFQNAFSLWTTANDKDGEALADLNLAYAHGDLGDLQKALELFDQSLSLFQGQGDQRGVARALTAAGSIYSILGQKQAALDKHLKAMELLRTIGDHADEAVALNSIGKAYEDLNKLATALDNYKQALNLYLQQGNLEFASVTKYYIGRVCNLMGDKETALKFFGESVSDSKLSGQPRVTAYALSAISGIQSQTGKKDEAWTQLQQAIRLYREIGDRRGQANALNTLAGIYHNANQNPAALLHYKRALNLYRAAGDKQGEAATLYSMAVVERAMGNLTGALTHVKESTTAIEALRLQIVSPELRASYYASVRQHAELYIDLTMRAGAASIDKAQLESAFEISEHAHARSLLEVLGEASAHIRQGVDPKLLEQEQILQQKLNAQALYKMRLLGQPEPHELEIVERDIRELTASYLEVETQIRQQSPRYANLVQPQPLTLKRIQDELPDGTLLLEYTLGAERSYVWAITNNSLNAYTLPGRDEIESLVKSVCALLVARQTLNTSDANYIERVTQADAEYWRQASRLSQILLRPVSDAIQGKTILVVPDGALYYLPFEALPAPGQNNNQGSFEATPLIVDHEVVTLASASILAAIRQTVRVGSNEEKLIAILADPVFSTTDSRVKKLSSAPAQQSFQLTDAISLTRLPATEDEAESIMALVPSGTGTMATGFDANRTMALSGQLGQYTIVHLATHGVVDVENPEMSGIVLSLVSRDGKSREGLVQLHDVYNMNLANTQLVVLSACETALGKEVRGEGLVGLSRGFMYAGASSVVASLWKVDDRATTELMTKFYKGLFEEGLTASAALRNAKLSMWRESRYHAPFYWAAFPLQGEYREKIVVPQRTHFVTRKLVLPIVITISAGIVLFIILKRRGRPRHA